MKARAMLVFALAACVILCADCSSGKVDKDALARGLVAKIDRHVGLPSSSTPSKWERLTPPAGPLGR